MRVESLQQTGAESSDSEDDKFTRRNKAGNSPSTDRFDQFRPFNSNEGQIHLRPPRPPAQLFEGLIRAKQEAAKAETAEPAAEAPEPARRTEAFRVPLSAETADVATAEATVEDDDEEDEAKADGSPSTTSSTTPTWRPSPLPSIETAADDTTELEDVVDEVPEPVHTEAPVYTASHERPFEDVSDPEDASVAGGGTPPPAPPFGSSREFGSFDDEPEPAATTAAYASPPPAGFSTPNTAPNMPNPQAFEQDNKAAINEAEYYAEKRGLRRGLIAGFITGYVLKAFLANRKLKRFEQATKKEFKKQNQAISRYESEQYRLRDQVAKAEEFRKSQERLNQYTANQPVAARFEGQKPVPLSPGVEAQPVKQSAEILPPIQEVSEEGRVVDFNGEEVILLPGQRLERKGWYSVVVDEHGREVRNVIPRGEAFRNEQKEKLRTAAAADDGSAPAAGGVYSGQADVPMIASGQVDVRHELPAGPPVRVDWSHRLSPPQNPVVKVVKSPWLWAAIAALFIAYFTAALV